MVALNIFEEPVHNRTTLVALCVFDSLKRIGSYLFGNQTIVLLNVSNLKSSGVKLAI